MAVLSPHDVHQEIHLLRSLNHPNVSPSNIPLSHTAFCYNPVSVSLTDMSVRLYRSNPSDHPPAASHAEPAPAEKGMGAGLPVLQMYTTGPIG